MTLQEQRLMNDAARIFRHLLNNGEAAVWADVRDWLKAHAQEQRAAVARKG